jgi:hypothetical protein
MTIRRHSDFEDRQLMLFGTATIVLLVIAWTFAYLALAESSDQKRTLTTFSLFFSWTLNFVIYDFSSFRKRLGRG